MKHIVALLLGIIAGAVSFALAVIYNPLTGDGRLSPLSVTDAEIISLSFSVVPSESIVYTNDGESMQPPHPAKVTQLWEAPVRQTSGMVAVMHNARGEPAGVGVKLSSRSEKTRLFNGDAIVDSVWYIYLADQGGMFIGQTENYWGFLTDVAFPAWRSGANTWRGTWMGDVTAGPGVLGTAFATGTSGRLKGLEMEAVESLSVQAFSSETGFVSAEGRLTVALPEASAAELVDQQ
jgi:hypothetical protein